jgi:hypothetical protein
VAKRKGGIALANLLANLKTFLDEVQKQTQLVESSEETGGFLTIKFKQLLSENETIAIMDLLKKLQLEPYVEVQHEERIEENSDEAINDFLEKMAPYVAGEPKLNKQELIVTLKLEAVASPSTYKSIMTKAAKIGAKPLMTPKPGFSIPPIKKLTGIAGLHVDLSRLHADRIRDFFHPDISKDDAAESIKYLVSLGWDEKSFRELGVPRSSFFHLRKKAED